MTASINPEHRAAAINLCICSSAAYKINAHARANGARRNVYDSRSFDPRLTRLAKAHDFAAIEELKNEMVAQVEAFLPGFEAAEREQLNQTADRHDTAIREAKAAGGEYPNICGLGNCTGARLHVCALHFQEEWRN